jgi:hypothetical protein
MATMTTTQLSNQTLTRLLDKYRGAVVEVRSDKCRERFSTVTLDRIGPTVTARLCTP